MAPDRGVADIRMEPSTRDTWRCQAGHLTSKGSAMRGLRPPPLASGNPMCCQTGCTRSRRQLLESYPARKVPMVMALLEVLAIGATGLLGYLRIGRTAHGWETRAACATPLPESTKIPNTAWPQIGGDTEGYSSQSQMADLEGVNRSRRIRSL